MTCKKCNSENVTIQFTTKSKRKGKGCIYWLLLGWWLEPILWLFATLPMLLLTIFGVGKHTDVKSVKTAVCQDCGHSWKV